MVKLKGIVCEKWNTFNLLAHLDVFTNDYNKICFLLCEVQVSTSPVSSWTNLYISEKTHVLPVHKNEL